MNESWVATGVVGVVSLIVYLRTMCRTIYVGDSGELAAAVHVAGIPHPPGYPLYVLLGKLFSVLLPIGTPALRLNIFSAVCSTASSIFLDLTLTTLGFDAWLASAAALAWSFSASLWSQSGIPRVYALGACMSSLATFCFARWYISPESINWLIAAGFVVGVAMCNHPVAGAHLPAIAAGIVLRDPVVLSNWKLWITGAAATLLPIVALYFVWLPLRARSTPIVNWGNLRTFADLRRFLARKDYWQYRWVHNPRQAIQVVDFYVRRAGTEFGFLGAAAIVVGLPILFEHHRAIFAMSAALVGLNALSMVAHARREDIFHWTRYMITAWLALMLPLAAGVAAMISLLPERARPFVAFLPAIVLLISQFRRQDLSRHRYADEYNRRILTNLPEGATLIAQDDNVVFPLMYLHHAEHVRPDVKLLEQGVHQLGELRFNPKRDAVYCTHWQAAFNQPPSPRGPGLRLIPEGLVYRIVSTDMQFQPRDLWREQQHVVPDIEDPHIPRNYLTRCLLGNVYFMRAEWELPRDAVAAVGWYERAARMAWDNAVMQYNVGLVYQRNGWKMLSEDAFARAVAIDGKYDRSKRQPGAATSS